MSNSPKPQTYGAAMRALEGSQAALTEALAELTTTVDELDSTRARLAFAQAALREETARAMTWKRVAKRVRQRANNDRAKLWRVIENQVGTIRQVADDRNTAKANLAAASARVERLRAALEAAQALETFYISRAWAMYEDEASLWAAFAEARRAALEAGTDASR